MRDRRRSSREIPVRERDAGPNGAHGVDVVKQGESRYECGRLVVQRVGVVRVGDGAQLGRGGGGVGVGWKCSGGGEGCKACGSGGW